MDKIFGVVVMFTRSNIVIALLLMVIFLSLSVIIADDSGTSGSNYEDSVTAVDSNSLSSGSNKPITLSQKSILFASKSVKDFIKTNGKLPNNVIIDGFKYSMSEYMYILSKTIINQYKNNNSNIKVKYDVLNPNKPSGGDIKGTISSNLYYTYAQNIVSFIEKNNRAPNYVNSALGKIQYQTAIYGLNNVLSFIYNNGRLPSTLSLDVKASHSMNKYLPIYNRNNDSSNQNNAIWVHSGDMKTLDLDQLADCGIDNIILHEKVFDRDYNEAVNWIQQTAAKGFKVHIWINCFKNTTTDERIWINPIKDGALNQDYFDIIISNAEKYSRLKGVAGISLDYIRYPGTDSKAKDFTYDNGTKNGTDAITEFARQCSVAVKNINENSTLSACLMPEKSEGIPLYGQDANQLGQHLDVLMPMIYKGNYKKDSAWIKSTTEWYNKNSGGAQVWGGIQAYRSDSDPYKLPVEELKIDCKSVLNGGGDGVVIFRYGVSNLFNMLDL